MRPVKATINGEKKLFVSKHALARCLMDLLKDSYSPLEAKATNLSRIMGLIGLEKRSKYIAQIFSEKGYELAYWETILAMEHMGTLPGFSVSCNIEKGSSNFNPERKRISEDWTIE